MKKKLLVAISAMILAGSAMAQHRHHHNHNTSGYWIGPMAFGAFAGYAIASSQQPRVVYVEAPPAPYMPPPVPVYREETYYDAYCNCYRTVMRQVGWR